MIHVISEPDSATEIRIVVGLGNPGRDYDGTRHNIGFEIVDRLARESGATWQTEKKWRAEVARCGSTILVKPQTYMNLSGSAAAAVGGFYKLPPASMLVVFDDADLPLGQLRFRADGSAGGHNGIKSMIQSFGSDRFARLKFGIGRRLGGDSDTNAAAAETAQKRSMVGHVLGKFSKPEREELEKLLANAVDAVNCALSRGLAAAMNEYNRNLNKPERIKRPRETQPIEKPNHPESEAPESRDEPGPEPES